ncbi:ATP-binding protein [Thermovenabulum sp.]|uniref:ATP-binding protein n=1 Tax=Thermovenabulum sp. TaxID=3100335 RepID=UPI003C7D99A6
MKIKIKNSILWKLWAFISLISIVAIIFSGLILSKFFEDFYFRIKENELINEGQQLISLILRGSNVEEFIDITKFINANAVLIDKRGTILVCPKYFHPKMGMILDKNELNSILNGKILVKRNFFRGVENPMLMVALPVATDGNVIGGLLLFSPMASLSSSVWEIRKLILLSAFFAILLSSGTSLVFSKSITKPLLLMKEAAEEMAKGNFDKKVEIIEDDEVGTLARTMNFLSDALKQNLNALSKEKDQLKSILLGMTDGVITFDENNNIVMANSQAMELLNIKEKENAGEEALQILKNALFRLYDLKENIVEEINLDGKIILAKVSPLLNDGVKGAVVVLQDVTKEKKLENLRREFVANVSHELRTPLTYIQGYSEAILDGMVEDKETLNNYINIILEETLRLKRLVNDLLDLSLMENGQGTLKKDKFSINRLIERVVQKMHNLAAQKGVKFILDLRETPLLFADEDRIEQVLINLIDNALRYSPEGGEIIISTELGDDGDIRVGVKDKGPGIPEDELPFIWERFYKVDKSRARQKGGTGLGLAIVKSIIENHGGRVWASNDEKGGSVFYFSLPCGE